MSRGKRELEENVWYFIRTALNDREPMFWSKHLIWLFRRVLSELLGLFAVEIRGLRFDGATVSFYIRPDKGLELPKIIKWVKQTFGLLWLIKKGKRIMRINTNECRAYRPTSCNFFDSYVSSQEGLEIPP
jgi:hypothetical protein